MTGRLARTGGRGGGTRDALRAQALQRATEIVTAGGIGALTARKLAGDLGCSVGTLYNLFDNLDELILRVNARTLDDLGSRLTAVSDGRAAGTGDRATLVALALAYVAYARSEPQRYGILFEHRMAGGAALPSWYAEKVDGLFAIVERVLRPLLPGVAGPDVGQPDARSRTAAAVLWSSLHGICTLGLSGRLDQITGATVEAMATDLVETYLAGLRSSTRDGD